MQSMSNSQKLNSSTCSMCTSIKIESEINMAEPNGMFSKCVPYNYMKDGTWGDSNFIPTVTDCTNTHTTMFWIAYIDCNT